MAPSSMTGFGSITVRRVDTTYTMELRTLNSRYKDVRVKTAVGDGALEYALRTALDKGFSRGRLDLSLEARSLGGGADSLSEELDALTARFPGQTPGLTDLLLLRITRSMERGEPRGLDDDTRRALLDALDGLMETVRSTRAAEGAVMTSEMERLLTAMTDRTGEIEARAAGEGDRFRERFNTKLAHLVSSDMDRIALEREVALLIERADINEELARLRGHLASFGELLAKDGPAGRNMEFLCQEILRETNTIGSKTQDLTISTLGVAMKNDVERLRELSANME